MRRSESSRFVRHRWLGALGLALAIVAAGTSPAVTDEGKPGTGPAAPDLALLRARSVTFVTLDVKDLVAGGYLRILPPAVKAEVDRAAKRAERIAGLTLADIERTTVLFPDGIFVRTSRPVDAEKLAAGFAQGAVAVKEGNYMVYVSEDRQGAFAVIDDRHFVMGLTQRIRDFLRPPAEGTAMPEGAAELLNGKHLIVAGINPAYLVPLLETRPLSPPRGPVRYKSVPPPPPPKTAPPELFQKKSAPKSSYLPQPRQLLPLLAVAAMADEPRQADALADLPLEALPFKPFLQARYIALALDAWDSIRLQGRLFYRNADDARDGETALRMALYLAREAPAALLRKEPGLRAEQSPQLHELFDKLAKAQRQATVERRDAEVQFRLEVSVNPKLLIGAVEQANRASARTQSQNNLKQIALAMHNFHAVYDRLPAAAICDAKGKPLLSWRVALLPFLGEEALYNQFKFDEPWDGENNKKLLDRMPRVYAIPGDSAADRNETRYRVFVGKDAAFPVENWRNGPVSLGLRFTDVSDGTSNTILAVEAAKPVQWTKPDELTYAADKPVPELGGPSKEGSYVAFMDGSVRFLPKGVSEKTLRALITPAGGETIDYQELEMPRPAVPSKSYPVRK
jgi:hypothetical protein